MWLKPVLSHSCLHPFIIILSLFAPFGWFAGPTEYVLCTYIRVNKICPDDLNMYNDDSSEKVKLMILIDLHKVVNISFV